MAAYNSVHIASSLSADQAEADDHMTGGLFTSRAVDNSRVLSAETVDELIDLFTKLRNERADLDYLDFHCHGDGGTLSLGREDFNYTHLAQFRDKGFESIFRPEAVIDFLSCDVAAAWFDEPDEDGELFLAEFAHIFLHRKGGRAIGRNKPMRYKPAYQPFFGPSFRGEGTEIIAEVAPGARYATLKGQYRLDSRRIRGQIATLKLFLTTALGLTSPSTPQPPANRNPHPVDILVAAILAVLPMFDPERAWRSLSYSLPRLEMAESDLRARCLRAHSSHCTKPAKPSKTFWSR